ncbi:MAG: CocE/NonD family hydrolase, partial [Gemmatimonadota bacterium]
MKSVASVACLSVGIVLGVVPPPEAAAQQESSTGSYLQDHYLKYEYRVRMRDGIELFTVVYAPRDSTRAYPILLKRTPYSCRPYGPEAYPGRIGPSPVMEEEGYVFVCQDVRGRYMSEGRFDNMRPHVDGDAAIDESSDTYDTVEWLIHNVPRNNGKVGMWGISYPGFY